MGRGEQAVVLRLRYSRMDLLRSTLHALWMLVTVVPYALAIVLAAPFASSLNLYRIAAAWLRLTMQGLRGRVVLVELWTFG